jgi:hypothetical protein
VSQQAAVDAALLVLKSMGLSLEDLTAASSNRPPVPTFAEYVPVVAATVTPGTLRAYRPYWKRAVEQWGDRHLDEPTPSEIKQLVAYVKANAVPRRNSRGGHNAAENLISALRCLYLRAVDDGLIGEKDNPARKVDKPRRLPSTRRALDDARLAGRAHRHRDRRRRRTGSDVRAPRCRRPRLRHGLALPVRRKPGRPAGSEVIASDAYPQFARMVRDSPRRWPRPALRLRPLLHPRCN